MEEQDSTMAKPTPPSTSIVENWVTVLSRNTKNQKDKPLPKLPSNQSEILNSMFVEKEERERKKQRAYLWSKPELTRRKRSI